jgi:hypothetical protein
LNLYLKRLFVTRLRKVLFVALVIIVASALTAYAYWKSLHSTNGPKVTLTSPPFELSFALDKTEYSLKDNMSINFCLRNTSNKTVTLTRPNLPYIIDPNGSVYKLATLAEGVTIPDFDSGLLYHSMTFGFILSHDNGTVIENNLGGGQIPQTYDIVFEPNASLNQTLSINLTGYRDPYDHSIQGGAFRISGGLSAYPNGAENLTGLVTWETPSIVFTIK